MTPFELRALAFADLIEDVVRQQSSAAVVQLQQPEPNQELAKYDTIRCICGNNDNTGELVRCPVCHCYLHIGCVEQQNLRRGAGFKCPFCRLQLDGVDPFRDLRNWVNEELKTIHRLIDMIVEVSTLESQLASGMMGGPEFVGIAQVRGVSRTNPGQLRQMLARKVQEIKQSLLNLTNQ